MTEVRKWKQDHNKNIERMKTLSALVHKEKREFTNAESEEYSKLEKETESLKESIERENRFNNLQLLKEPTQDIPKSEQRTYSLTNAIKCLLNGKRTGSFECEIHQDLEKRNIHSGEGFLIPTSQILPAKETRIVDSTDTNLISDPIKADEYLKALYEASLMNRLGLHRVNAKGNFHFPKSGGATSGWFAGDGSDSIAESDPSYSNLEARPKFLGTISGWSLKILKSMSANLSLERILRQDLSEAMSEKLDEAIVKGTGTGNEPSGITVAATNVSATKDRSGSVAWNLGEILDQVEAIKKNFKNNAMNLKWLISTTIWKEWASTVAFTDTDTTLLDVARKNGEVIVTNHLNQSTTAPPNNAPEGVLGQWNQFMLVMFDSIELSLGMIDDDFKKVITRLRAVGCFDLVLRRNEGFQKLIVDRKA